MARPCDHACNDANALMDTFGARKGFNASEEQDHPSLVHLRAGRNSGIQAFHLLYYSTINAKRRGLWHNLRS